MEVEETFVAISALICEPVRAKMLWNLLDGRAYTASELAIAADVSATSASNHLSKLLEADIIKVEVQGRHRYFSFSTPEVAYAIEALANLASDQMSQKRSRQVLRNGVNYCRTCYDHLAGYVGVSIVEAMEAKGYLVKCEKEYFVTEKGWKWFGQFDIVQKEFKNSRRPLTRQCLDWSERRPHLAGRLGSVFLEKVIHRQWFKRVDFSRELIVTAKGRQELYELLGIDL
ncbi:DNA-binding transcriptional ArsR family regulator [Algoriphagus sp. 4150]|uniref:ArsR/SmtB family transcription factor n=1 Tax=Algoriphagus sp. 4150 TaxID=2817756 RepID=UPI002856A79E|nr:helix-turn-helix transcriptional regulator [Algoriphagus sp. 4150]MDR7131330.1 DNA-binding transcriptional ArsR family regulator [Algoriphagus sp. 4150]